MADSTIELEIVLDDGSIRKAFGSIRKESENMARESARIFEQEFQRQDFIKKAFDKQNIDNALRKILRSEEFTKSAKDSADVFSEQFEKRLKVNLGQADFFSAQTITAIGAGIFIFERFAQAIKNTADNILNLSLEAERVRVTTAQFGALTEQNNINTESFAKALERSAAGLIEVDTALLIANNSMIRIGESSQRLPEIFELSRKAAAAGFGDIANNAEILVQAIQTGNVRQLRALGLTVDLTKAQSDFAKSLGLTSDQLTEQQRIFANSNAILDQASKKFGDTNANIRTFSDSLTRLQVLSKEVFEAFAISFDSVFGVRIKRAIDAASLSLSNFLGSTTTEQRIQDLKFKLEDLNKSYDEIARSSKLVPAVIDVLAPSFNEATLSTLRDQMRAVREEINQLSQVNYASLGQANDLIAKNVEKYAELQRVSQLTEQQREQAYQREVARQQSLLQMSNQFEQTELSAREAMIQTMADQDLVQQEREAVHMARLVQIAEQGNAQRLAIETQFSDAKGFTQEQRDALELQRVNATNAQLLAAQQNYQIASEGAWGQYVQNARKTLGDFGNYTKTVLVQGLGTSLAAVGSALAKGEDSWVAFRNSFLGILGDIAIQMGNMFIAMGIANQAIPIFGNITGAAAIAAGAALVVLGGALKAFSGGAGAGGGAATAGGGGVAGGSVSEEPLGFSPATPLEETRVQPNTIVNFTVQGDILDSDSTQSRIVALLNDAIDTKGAVVRGLA